MLWVVPMSLSCPTSLPVHCQQEDREDEVADCKKPCPPAGVAGDDLEPVQAAEDREADAQDKAEISAEEPRSGLSFRAAGLVHHADVTKGGTRQGPASGRAAS